MKTKKRREGEGELSPPAFLFVFLDALHPAGGIFAAVPVVDYVSPSVTGTLLTIQVKQHPEEGSRGNAPGGEEGRSPPSFPYLERSWVVLGVSPVIFL